MKRAFTLIELLVVIAIIAILAAILFPVFAQAKMAAKASVAISNVKQAALGMVMYSADVDDVHVPRVRIDLNGGIVDERSWKHMTAPYVKSVDMFKDPANPASKFRDMRSDPIWRAYRGFVPNTLPSNEIFNRGYYYANIFVNGAFVDNKTFSVTSLSEPAKVFSIVEGKRYIEDIGPFAIWTENVDSQNAGQGASAPVTGLRWNQGGDKWSNKAQVVGYHDGHSKRITYSEMCGNSFFNMPEGATQVDNWGMSRAQKGGWDWVYNQGCRDMPAQFR